MRAKIQKWGNSLAVRIPKPLANDADLIEGAEVEISVEGGRLVISPIARELTLDEMLDLVTPENRHGLVDWGPAMGKEAW
ncbi:MAG TPA: AbrB/MazE/SpoVT family DNA-binding domain-containing protein [Longimicrobium sp.]|nr:AbrB/MazE/SpoVT family DNA-binding domain-containing protein [Longimicrobium sp.]